MLRVSNTYATIFNADVRDKVVFANVSTSKKLKTPIKDKNGNDTNYRNSLWYRTGFVGEAYDKATELEDRDRIFIKSGEVGIETYQDKEDITRYIPKLVVYDFCYANEVEQNETSQPKKTKSKPKKEQSSDEIFGEDDDLPI